MKRLATGFTAVGMFLVASSATAQMTAPNPDEVYIKRITYSGSGCAEGTMVGNISDDAKAFTLLFDSYLVEAGAGIPEGYNKAKCKITVDLRFPQGWSYTLFDVDYRGYLSLDPGVVAYQDSVYYFQATPHLTTNFGSTFYGPNDMDYEFTDTIELDDLTWSPCGRTRALNIDTSLEIDNSRNPGGGGVITVDSIDGELEHIYGIKWVYCGG